MNTGECFGAPLLYGGIMEDHRYALDLIQGMADRTARRLWTVLIVQSTANLLLVGVVVWLVVR